MKITCVIGEGNLCCGEEEAYCGKEKPEEPEINASVLEGNRVQLVRHKT